MKYDYSKIKAIHENIQITQNEERDLPFPPDWYQMKAVLSLNHQQPPK
jgi:hypothetical protein